MPFTPSTNHCWRPLDRWPYLALPADIRSFLVDTGSLTQRLVDASDGEFSVRILRQQLARPTRDEATILGVPGKRLALVREVFLLGRGQPWVFARSIIPLSTMTGRLRSLRHLDNRPLGALLFADPTMTRSPLEVGLVPATRVPEESGCSSLWGRRSVFFLDAKPLLVSEIFLPAFTP